MVEMDYCSECTRAFKLSNVNYSLYLLCGLSVPRCRATCRSVENKAHDYIHQGCCGHSYDK